MPVPGRGPRPAGPRRPSYPERVVTGAHRALLRVWRHVPLGLRRLIVRVAAPSFTVGAACVVERDGGEVLLVRLVYRTGWGLPGGLIERGEEVAGCARREVGEEVGLDVELIGAPAVVVDSRARRVDVVFRARPAAGHDPGAAAPCSPEVVEARWFPAHDLPPLQHEAVSALLALASALPGDAWALAGRGDAGDGPGGGGGDDVVRGGVGGGGLLRAAAASAAAQRPSTTG